MSIFINAYLNELNKIKKQGDNTFKQLSDEQMYWSADENTNSIAILIQHISGNIISRSTEFLTSDGEKKSRNRDAEFQNQQFTKEQLLTIWEDAWAIFFDTVSNLSEEDLFHIVRVKGKEMTATAALLTQLVHYSGHIAQILAFGKMILQEQWQSPSAPTTK